MVDPRIAAYARLLVERCIAPEPGWQVVVNAQVAARPLVEEVQRLIARRGAYAVTQLTYDTVGGAWARAASNELLARPSPIARKIQSTGDAFIAIVAPENARDAVDVPPERLALQSAAATILRERL